MPHEDGLDVVAAGASGVLVGSEERLGEGQVELPVGGTAEGELGRSARAARSSSAAPDRNGSAASGLSRSVGLMALVARAIWGRGCREGGKPGSHRGWGDGGVARPSRRARWWRAAATVRRVARPRCGCRVGWPAQDEVVALVVVGLPLVVPRGVAVCSRNGGAGHGGLKFWEVGWFVFRTAGVCGGHGHAAVSVVQLDEVGVHDVPGADDAEFMSPVDQHRPGGPMLAPRTQPVLALGAVERKPGWSRQPRGDTRADVRRRTTMSHPAAEPVLVSGCAGNSWCCWPPGRTPCPPDRACRPPPVPGASRATGR